MDDRRREERRGEGSECSTETGTERPNLSSGSWRGYHGSSIAGSWLGYC